MSRKEKEKIYAVSLGCPRNRVDTEGVLFDLESTGFGMTRVPEEASVILVNTCAFLTSAVEESVETILDLADLKNKGSCKKLIVTGCLPARYSSQLHRLLPEVDLFVEPSDLHELASLVARELDAPGPGCRHGDSARRVLTTPEGTAYLRISDGCDRSCSFCIIPKLRGRHKSRPLEDIVQEAEGLAASGVKEINLVAQDLTGYGSDLASGPNLSDLLEVLDEIEGIEWIRCMYAYPTEVNETLLDTLAGMKRAAPYLDVPIQHVSSRVLKAMRRGYDSHRVRAIVQSVRERLPDFFLRTTVMVGHPAETREDLDELLAFLEEAGFEHLGAFRFSPEEGTPASSMPETPSRRESYHRWRKVMALQRKISRKKQRALLGRVMDVIVTGTADDSSGLYVGRHMGQAPEVDGAVMIRLWDDSPARLEKGRIYPVEIEGTSDYDLVGRAIDLERRPQGKR